MIEPGRKFVQGIKKYRYSINGQEKETELNENITTAEYWMYDSRLGRRWNVDPVLKEYESPYLCFSANPILLSDHNGDDSDPPWWKKLLNYIYGSDVKEAREATDNISAGVEQQIIGPWNAGEIFNSENPGLAIAYRKANGQIQSITGVVQLNHAVQNIGTKTQAILEAPLIIKEGVELLKKPTASLIKKYVSKTATSAETQKQVELIKNWGGKKNYTTQGSESLDIPPIYENPLRGRQLIVDQNLSPKLVQPLEQAGFNVKRFPAGTKDAEIINYAKETNSMVLTNNIKDFRNKGVTAIKVTDVQQRNNNLIIQQMKKLDATIKTNPSMATPGKVISLANPGG